MFKNSYENASAIMERRIYICKNFFFVLFTHSEPNMNASACKLLHHSVIKGYVDILKQINYLVEEEWLLTENDVLVH